MHVRYKFPKQHKVAKFLELFCQVCIVDSLNWVSFFTPEKKITWFSGFGKERLIAAVMYRYDRRKQRNEPTLRLFCLSRVNQVRVFLFDFEVLIQQSNKWVYFWIHFMGEKSKGPSP